MSDIVSKSKEFEPSNDHVMLSRVGAMWMYMNAENGYKFDDGALNEMENFNMDECAGRYNPQLYFNYCCLMYSSSGLKGLTEIINGNVPLITEG
ncbi:hypothetical protein REH81_23670 [Vibrio rotiferianus]|uniref:hypothetical protein n=1 Tax=Vibrio harveyi TaxID=669 RepID=UPI002F59D8F4